MDLNELFKSEDKSFELHGYIFKFKEVTIEDENNNWQIYYPDGRYNPSMYETFRLCLFTETPFNKEFINGICEINKDWNEMTIPERFTCISKMKGEGIKEIKEKFVEATKHKEVDKLVGN